MTLNLELVSVRLSSLPVHVLFFSCAVGTNMDQLFLLRAHLETDYLKTTEISGRVNGYRSLEDHIF